MAELLDDIAVYLAANVAGLSVWNGSAGNIWKGIMPDQDGTGTPTYTVAVCELPGGAPVELMGGGQPAIERPGLSIFSRAASGEYTEAKQLARSIWRALTLVVNTTVNGTYYERIEATASPYVDDRDEAGRVTFGQNFSVWRAVTP